VDHGDIFTTQVQFGTETFEQIVDTGSSDTWMIETGFTCINFTEGVGSTAPESACGFGPTYTITDTFEQIPDENFNIFYGTGDEWLNGIMGYEEVTLAGITVKMQVALASLASWYVTVLS
jgi:hypothetical protein